jgi:hypothetical protein
MWGVGGGGGGERTYSQPMAVVSDVNFAMPYLFLSVVSYSKQKLLRLLLSRSSLAIEFPMFQPDCIAITCSCLSTKVPKNHPPLYQQSSETLQLQANQDGLSRQPQSL